MTLDSSACAPSSEPGKANAGSSSPMQVRAVGFGGRRTPSTRYRLLQLLEPLRARGVFIEFQSSEDLGSWKALARFIRDSDAPARPIVWIQKKLFPARWIWKIARNHPIVFDFDDAIWTSERADRSAWTRWRASWKLNWVLRMSSLVIAGNDYLAAYASKHAARVVTVPTVINVEDYPVKTHRPSSGITLGWIGQSVNHVYLEQLVDVLVPLRAELDFRLLVVSDRPFASNAIEVLNRNWSLETETQDILDMDIGLMPLDDTPWSRGKCAFKAIQYMAAGIPAVASRVGANIELIADGENGRLVETPQQWREAILALAKNPDARQHMGALARRTVEARYSTKRAVEEIAALFQTFERTSPHGL